MKEMSVPDSDEEIYRDWDEPPPISRPLMQGDVFADVSFGGFQPEPKMLQVVTHACTMRAGAALRPRITVVPIVERPVIDKGIWKRMSRIMPLPQLNGPNAGNWASDLCEPITIDTDLLTPERRVTTLSDDGILLLQQRLIFFATRFIATLDELYQLNAHIFSEMELQEDWCEAALSVNAEKTADEVTATAAGDFQGWLDREDDTRKISYRELLKTPRERNRIRQMARKEMDSRYPNS